MPIHDWTRVEDGIFHDFHHAWIEEIKRALNNGVLPADYYAMAEQHAAGFGSDVLTLQGSDNGLGDTASGGTGDGGVGLLLAPPKVHLTDEVDRSFYLTKQKSVAIHHVSGDKVVAMIEVVSPGNKSSANAMRSFVAKAAELLNRGIHLLILDVFPPTPRDPNGIHGTVWRDVANRLYDAPDEKPLTVVSYAAGEAIRAYAQHFTVGEPLPDMPLFLLPEGHVEVPLEATYHTAWAAVPRRWRNVLEPRPAAPDA